METNNGGYKDPKWSDLKESVNHPYHYTAGQYEVIDIIYDQLGINGIRGFCLGNAIKYICRAQKKSLDERQDLEKAVWYLNHYLEVLGEK